LREGCFYFVLFQAKPIQLLLGFLVAPFLVGAIMPEFLEGLFLGEFGGIHRAKINHQGLGAGGT
jgi:hypothetical protein